MPSLHEQTIYNFTELLNNQYSLFSDEDRAYLDKLIASQPDDIEQLSNAILEWCEANPEIDHALAELELEFKENPSGELRLPGVNMGKKPPLDKKHPKKILLNAIQESSASSSSN